MDIVKAFTDAWNIYLKNFMTILLATIAVLLLGMITIGILYLPLMIGLQMMFVKAKRGETIVFNDIFAPLKKFWSLWGGAIWIGLLGAIGIILLIVPGLCWLSWWMYALLFIYDKNLGIGAGMRASKEIVRKNNIWLHLLFLLLAGFISNLGTYVLWVGFLVTMPLGMGAIACAYADEAK